MKIALTFDIEVKQKSKMRLVDCYTELLYGALRLADELEETKTPATFFVSLSPKSYEIDHREYLKVLRILLKELAEYKFINVQPHMHAANVNNNNFMDQWSSLSLEEQVKLLVYARETLGEFGHDVDTFRSGSFSKNEHYYRALSEAGYTYSSMLLRDEEPNLIFKRGKFLLNASWKAANNEGVIEIPVTSVKLRSVKCKTEMLNLSAEFFSYDSLMGALCLDKRFVLNFHSFSYYNMRFLREKHNGMWPYNFKMLLLKTIQNAFVENIVLTDYETFAVNNKKLISSELKFVKLHHLQ